MENYQSFPFFRSIVSVYGPFSAQTKEYEMLKKYTNLNDMQNDSLVNKISQFYVGYLSLIDDNNSFVKKEVLENIDFFKEKSWFVDWIQGKFTDEMKEYFIKGEDFRKRAAANLIFAIRNHKSVIANYNNDAKELIEMIDKRINKEEE